MCGKGNPIGNYLIPMLQTLVAAIAISYKALASQSQPQPKALSETAPYPLHKILVPSDLILSTNYPGDGSTTTYIAGEHIGVNPGTSANQISDLRKEN